MKKRILSICALLGAASLLCGFDSAQTAETIIQKQQEAIASVSSMDTDMKINGDLAIDLAGAQLTALANGTIHVEFIAEEPALKIESSIDVTTPLMAQENTKDYKLYVKKNASGTPEIFIYQADAVTGEKDWDHNTEYGVDIDSLLGSMPTVNPDKLAKFGIGFELDQEPADVNGTECYRLFAVLDIDTFSALLGEIEEEADLNLSSGEYYDLILSVLEGLKINLEYFIDAQTYLPLQMHLDLNDSELDMIGELIHTYMQSLLDTEEEFTVTIDLKDASLDMTTVYDTVTEIIVPDEAIAASAEKDSIPDDLEAEMIYAAEKLTEAGRAEASAESN